MSLATKPKPCPLRPGSAGVSRRRVLVFMRTFLPGYKSGGPVRAVSSMIDNLSDRFDFFVVTRDRDAGDTVPYAGIVPDQWHCAGNCSVFYASSVNFSTIRQTFRDVEPHVIHLNSFHESFTRKVILLRRFGLLGRTPVLLAPRGEFAAEAMKIKWRKKMPYRFLSRLLGLYDGVSWQISSPHEKEDLVRAAPSWKFAVDDVYLTGELSQQAVTSGDPIEKVSGQLKLVFVARISEMKNVDYLFEVVRAVNGQVQLDLYGPVPSGDAAYWKRCQSLLEDFPPHIKVIYHGAIDHSQVSSVLRSHHFLVLPTRGENFCHSAVESLNNGIPVILSDATPWRNLADAEAGFDVPLANRDAWISILQKCVDMDGKGYQRFTDGARRYRERFSSRVAIEKHLEMFEQVINPTGERRRHPKGTKDSIN